MIYYNIGSGYIIMIYKHRFRVYYYDNIGPGYIIMTYYNIGSGYNYYDLL